MARNIFKYASSPFFTTIIGTFLGVFLSIYFNQSMNRKSDEGRFIKILQASSSILEENFKVIQRFKYSFSNNYTYLLGLSTINPEIFRNMINNEMIFRTMSTSSLVQLPQVVGQMEWVWSKMPLSIQNIELGGIPKDFSASELTVFSTWISSYCIEIARGIGLVKAEIQYKTGKINQKTLEDRLAYNSDTPEYEKCQIKPPEEQAR